MSFFFWILIAGESNTFSFRNGKGMDRHESRLIFGNELWQALVGENIRMGNRSHVSRTMSHTVGEHYRPYPLGDLP